MVDIKVDNRDTRQPTVYDRMLGRQCHVTEHAEAHSGIARGVMPRWANAAKRMTQARIQYRIDSSNGCTCRSRRSRPRVRIHTGIRVQFNPSGCPPVRQAQTCRLRLHMRNIRWRMRQQKLTLLNSGRLFIRQQIAQALGLQALCDGIQALWTLRVSCAHVVQATFCVEEKPSRVRGGAGHMDKLKGKIKGENSLA